MGNVLQCCEAKADNRFEVTTSAELPSMSKRSNIELVKIHNFLELQIPAARCNKDAINKWNDLPKLDKNKIMEDSWPLEI